MENLSDGWVGRARADGYGVVGKRGGRSSKKSGCRLRQLSIKRPGKGEPVENLSNSWVCRPRAGGYGVVGKRGGRSSKKSGCRFRRLGALGDLGALGALAVAGGVGFVFLGPSRG